MTGLLCIAGGSVPYANQTAAKQPYLTSYMWQVICFSLHNELSLTF